MKRWYVIFSLVLLLVVLGLLIWRAIGQKQLQESQALSTASAALSPQEMSLNAGESREIQLQISLTQTDKINSWEFYLTYDPGVVEINASEIQLGSNFSNWTKLISEVYVSGSQAQLRLAYYILQSDLYYSQGGTVVLASIPITGIHNGQTSLSFEQDLRPPSAGLPSSSVVNAQGISRNLLTSTQNASISVGSEIGTSVTTAPTSTPSPTTAPNNNSSSTTHTPAPTTTISNTTISTTPTTIPATITLSPTRATNDTGSSPSPTPVEQLLATGTTDVLWYSVAAGFLLLFLGGILFI